MTAHLKSVHKSESNVTCPVCFKVMKPKSMYTHMNEIHSEPLFNCDLCPESFKSRWFLKKHFQDCHSGTVEQWKCDLCSEQFQREIDFLNHTKMFPHVDNMKCEDETESLKVLDLSKPQIQ